MVTLSSLRPAMSSLPSPLKSPTKTGLRYGAEGETWATEKDGPVSAVGAPQRPASHVSPLVHGLPSLQAVPLGASGLEQMPVEGSQVPAAWHWSEAVHTTGLDPVHTPAWQVSICVQALPSLQALPSGLAG